MCLHSRSRPKMRRSFSSGGFCGPYLGRSCLYGRHLWYFLAQVNDNLHGGIDISNVLSKNCEAACLCVGRVVPRHLHTLCCACCAFSAASRAPSMLYSEGRVKRAPRKGQSLGPGRQGKISWTRKRSDEGADCAS